MMIRCLGAAALLLWLFASLALADSSSAQEDAAPVGDLPEAVSDLVGDLDGGFDPDLAAYFLALPSHAQDLFVEAIDNEFVSTGEHVRDLLSLELPTDAMELLLRDNCILCHTNSDLQDEETLFQVGEGGNPLLTLERFLGDVHYRRGLSCAGCHGGTAQDEDMADEIYERWPDADERHEDRTWIPDFCGRCHADPSFMRSYNPSLPTDQLAKYRESQHGLQLLGESDSRAAQCVSCHGVHGIRNSDSRLSKTHPQNIPSTCGACHSDANLMAGYKLPDGSPLPTDQVEQYQKSVHGIALLERGDLGAPECSDCHGNHAAMPPQVASVAQVCRTCHSVNGTLFDGSKHKLAFEANNWPECGRCHGEHGITRASDEMMLSEPGRLCYDCHAEYATDSPECQQTAEYFRTQLAEMHEAAESFEEEKEVLATKGLDIEELEISLNELNDAVRQSRSQIHSFDRSDFDEVAQAGTAAIESGHAVIEHAESEFDQRTRGLLAAIALMALMGVALYFKLRQMESREVAD